MGHARAFDNMSKEGVQPFRYVLQNELISRCRRNPKYSMRAFARSLEIQSSALSKILNGKRGISKSMFHKLALKLGLSPDDMEKFTSPQPPKERGFDDLLPDFFSAIGDWYYYAILELAKLPSAKLEPKWVAKSLGISVPEASIALEKLVRLQLLEIAADGRLITPPKDHSTTSFPGTTTAHRQHQKQILTKAIEALDEIAPELRDHSGMTMAISTSRLSGAKERIKKFRRELSAYLEGGRDIDEVYQLVISLYPLSQVSRSPK